MRLSLLSILPLAFLFSSCGNGSEQVTLEINLVHNGIPFEVGETLYKGDTAIKFELIHFYLSEIALDHVAIIRIEQLYPLDDLAIMHGI